MLKRIVATALSLALSCSSAVHGAPKMLAKGDVGSTALAAPSLFASEEEKTRRVVLLNAGGTVDMSGAESRSAGNAVQAIVRRMAAEVSYANIFERSPDSSNMGPWHWEKVIAAIQQWKDKKEALISRGEGHVNGIALAMGTDTLSELALVLSLEFSGSLQFPIAIFGAHTPLGQPGSDAESNLLKAKTLAADPSAPPRVYAVIGNDILLGSRVEKVLTKPGDEDGKYFTDYAQRVGYFDESGQIHWDPEFLALPPLSPPYKGGMAVVEEFGYVEHLIMDSTTPARVMQDARKRLHRIKSGDVASGRSRRHGLIIQGNFSSNPEGKAIKEACLAAQRDGIPVFTGSRSIKKSFGDSIHLIEQKTFRYSHARTKLSWLMRKGVSLDALAQELNADVAGETQGKEFPDYVFYETLAPNDFHKGSEVIKAFPGMGFEIVRDSIERLLETKRISKEIKPVLCLYAFGDGNLPTGERPIAESVRGFLEKEFPAVAARSALVGLKLFDLERHLTAVLSAMGPEDWDALLAHFSVARPGELLFADVVREWAMEHGDMDSLKRECKKFLRYAASGADHDALTRQIEESGSIIALRELCSALPMRIPALEMARIVPGLQREIARRMIKQALMGSHPILQQIGRAVDSGIRVDIRTSVVLSPANTRLYELGNMLLACGADSAGAKGWHGPLRMRRELSRPSEFHRTDAMSRVEKRAVALELDELPLDREMIFQALYQAGLRIGEIPSLGFYADLIFRLRADGRLAGKRMLEIGEGLAFRSSIPIFQELGLSIEGLELDVTRFDFAKRKKMPVRFADLFHVADEQMHYPPYDIVFGANVLDRLLEGYHRHRTPKRGAILRALAQIAYITKPGGLCLQAFEQLLPIFHHELEAIGWDVLNGGPRAGYLMLRRNAVAAEDLLPPPGPGAEWFSDPVAEAVVRNGLLNPEFVSYGLVARSMVNPKSEDFTLIYGAAGPDIVTPFLNCHFTTAYFLDLLRVSAAKLIYWRDRAPALNPDDGYFSEKRRTGLSIKAYFDSHSANGIEYYIIQELLAMGVQTRDMQVQEGKFGPEITFKIAQESRARKIVFVPRDIATGAFPAEWDKKGRNERFEKLLREGADGYFQKGLVISDKREIAFFADRMMEWVRPKGYFMLSYFPVHADEKSLDADLVSKTEEILQQRGLKPISDRRLQEIEALLDPDGDGGYGRKIRIYHALAAKMPLPLSLDPVLSSL